MKSSLIIIYNPAARRASRKKLEAARSFMEARGYAVTVVTTGKSGEAETLARQAVLQKPQLIIAAGGDGTINEVMNGLAFSGVPLGILPLGTTNVLAREIYLKQDLPALLRTISTGRPRPISLGRITARRNSTEQTRYFCLMAGIGFDGQTVRDVDLKLKRHTGPGAYVLSGLRTLLSYAPAELVFSLAGQSVRGYAAVLGNVSRYGGDFKVTPDARLEEPSLQACIFRGGKRRDLLRYVFLLLSGKQARDLLYLNAEELTISGKAPVQLDGDYFGETPATVTVARDAIRLIF